ncbi:MAG: hypothetical protein ACJ71Z_02435 [Aeromicrobium sp.]
MRFTGKRRFAEIVVSVGLAAAVSGTLAYANRKIVRNYFPLADEWSILANSHPRVADPQGWFTKGFRDYFTPPAGLPNLQGFLFSRPLFNATYWAVGRRAEPESGRYLQISHVGVGVCAGMTTLAVARSGGSLRSAAGTGAVLPLMPALVPSMTLLIHPCMAFDPLAAAVTQGATIAYEGGRLRTAAALLTAALLTKETALPTAAALPTLYALENRGRLLRDGRARRSLLALAAPAAAWFAVRRATFGPSSIEDSAYVFRPDPRGKLMRQARIAAKFPFWVNYGSLGERGLTVNKVAAGSLLLSNAAVVAGAVVELASRLRAGRPPSPDESSLAASYAFLLAMGTSSRYGVALDMSMLHALVQWRRERGRPSRAARVVSAGLALGVATNTVLTAKEYPRLERNFLAYADVGRKYVTALRRFGAGERVLVLNDPVTFWAPVKFLTRTLGIKAEVIKLADHPYSRDNLDGMTNTSIVSLEPPAGPGEPWRFSQSRGIDILSSHPLLPNDEPVHVDYGDGITIDLEPFASDVPPTDDHQRWEAMRIMPGDRPAHLLYYDPATGEFETVAVNA